jgi:diguanylate cyclase (GGDEF)-like protein
MKKRGNSALPPKVLEKLQFIRGSARVLVAWLLLSIILAALGWGLLLASLEQGRRDIEQRLLFETSIMARSYADRLTRIMDSVDQIARHVRLEWQLSGGKIDLLELKKSGLFAMPSLYYVSVVGADGFPRSSSLEGSRDIMLGDREYFLFQQHASRDELFISAPMLGRLSEKHVIQFSRRLNDADGKFAGVVLVSVQLDLFTANYDAAILGEHGMLAMLSTDGATRVVRSGSVESPPAAPLLGQTPDLQGQRGSLLMDSKAGAGAWFVDQRSRFVGWQALKEYPLIALTALDYETTMAPHRARQATITWYAAWITAALAVLTLIGLAMKTEMGWRKHKLQLTQASYRLATEEGSEGFYIVEPICAPDGSTQDFRTIDCNQRGADFFNLRRAQLIGRSVSSFRGNFDLDQFIGRLQEAMEKGGHESEVDVPLGSPLQLRWVHIKIVRSEHNLAIRLRDISDQKAHVEELQRRGDQDALTGLPNRHWVQTYLPQAVEGASREGRMLALLFIDLDGFKKVNDTAGHAAGDELLQHAAQRLNDAVRPHDKVVRFGGDEFVVILDRIGQREDAAHVAERVQSAFRQAFRLEQGVHAVGTSIGISIFPQDGADASTLLQNADIAMYSVKTNGKAGYQFFEPGFYTRLRARLELEGDIRSAIARNEFVMLYQPRVDTVSGVTQSLEALVRWQHPTRGLLEPREFIGLAEETGLIIGIGELVVDRVCAQLAEWMKPGRELVPVSVNVSPRQFNHADVAEMIVAALQRHGVPAHLLEVEVTESSVMEEGMEASHTLSALQRRGIKILVDDFGTGYSSLSQLQRLDFDVLKVDQTFTAEIAKSGESRVLFTAIVTMAHALGMRVVAEGVETLEQVRILKALQCDEIQGYYISPPLPPGKTQPILPPYVFPAQG